jgi:hypothetical protein
MPLTDRKNGHEQKYNSRFTKRKSSGKLLAEYHQPRLAAQLQSQFISLISVSCAENVNSIMNQDLLPDCTVLHSEDSTNCKIILEIQKSNAHHLSAQVLNTTTTNKDCSALKNKVCWVMKHQLQVIITGCLIMNIWGMWESHWKYSAPITLYCLQHTWFLEHSR